MSIVTFHVFEEILALLEAIEVTDDIDMSRFDTNEYSDVRAIVDMYLRPVVLEAIPENRDFLKLSMAYYARHGHVPYQRMRDRCQELSMQDPESWSLFFQRIGELLFGVRFSEYCNLSNVVEQNVEVTSLGLFRRA